MENYKKKILIAEDNDSNYLLYSLIFGKEFKVIRAVNGLDAINKYNEESPDAIIMDIKMPVMNGIEATSRIRKENHNVPIIALTGNAIDTERLNAINAGCNIFLEKPILNQDLKNYVASFLY